MHDDSLGGWHTHETLLFRPVDLDAERVPHVVRAHHPTLRTALEWAESYLAQPHPQLGRPGHVCPYVSPAMQAGTVRLGIVCGSPPAHDIDRAMNEYRRAFLDAAARNPRSRYQLAFLVLFPDLAAEEAPAVIDGAQSRLKPAFVDQGLMVGQFHPGPPSEPGIWNPDFRPLRAPIPLLAIRHMHPRDFPFLRERSEFVGAYLRFFGNRIPDYLRTDVLDAIERFTIETNEEPA
jgi:hypothetical protein